MMLSRRYELKFPMDVAGIQVFLAEARRGLEQDEHGREAGYRVSSQYFDTPDQAAYREKLDGEAVRRKLRLRYYSIDPGGDGSDPRVRMAFMEIKHRVDNTVFKERLRLTDEGAQAILEDSRELTRIEQHIVPADLKLRATIDTIVRSAIVPGFRSANVITYLREAWEGSQDARLRITFDTNLRVYRPSEFLDVASGTGGLLLPEDRSILEVKFDHAIPRWIRDVIVSQKLQLRRFSKYAAGCEVLARSAAR
ncbi:MAG TPA: polyphosphate polymerase domain-containing protein [Planctomycetota bacterium]|nr:polyphosphate polymerase domain-containing protein [Planctomycetota bacterium]